MLKRGRFVLCLMAAMLFAPVAPAQEGYSIDAVGTATVDVAPATVVFQLELLPGNLAAPELLQAVADFETTVRTEIQTRGLAPTQITFTGLNFTHPDMLGPNASVFLRFSAPQYATAEGAVQKYAALHDDINAIAAAAKARTFPEKFEPGDAEPVEAAAVARAVEKAYSPAKAAADVMTAKILSVANVSVGKLVWSDERSPVTDYNVRRMTCAATVNVQYVYMPAP